MQRRPPSRVAAHLISLVALAGVAAAAQAPSPAALARRSASADSLVYIGTYTGAQSKGIYRARLNAVTGTLTAPVLAAELVHPAFLALHPTGRFLYAINEVGDFRGQKAGAVSAFQIDRASGDLVLLNQVSSIGAGPCHLVVDHTGCSVLVANYGGGSVTALPISSDGRLGAASAFIQHHGSSVNPRRQEAPHAHCVNLDAANRFLFVADLGLDKVMIYKFDPAKGTLSPNDPAFATVQPGAGPRHMAFHPNGRYAYVINELNSTLTAFAYDAARGVLRELQTVSTLPSQAAGPNTTAEVAVHPSGKFLYGSNRGHDSIGVFAIDSAHGTLTCIQHQPTGGRTPRNFGLDPTGRWLLAGNQDTHSLVAFAVAPQTGRLTPTGQAREIGAPVCVLFLPVN
jgi:6-phosphogluconolactonase